LSLPVTAEEIVSELKASRKYGHLCDQTLNRMAAWALSRYPNRKLAVKNAKSKLHQVYGAFVENLDFTHLESVKCQLGKPMPEEDLRKLCLEVLESHTSSAERLSFTTEFYAKLFEVTGLPNRILDLACGLNPFTLPWMNLPDGVEYEARDIDSRLLDAIQMLFRHLKVNGEAARHDLLSNEAVYVADVIFLLKTLPCIEQQQKGASLPLLRKFHAETIVVSFPAQSLGGKTKGMVEHYESIATSLAAGLGRTMQKLAFPGESFYLFR